MPADQLPVELPDLPDFRSAALDPYDEASEPVPPLARAGDWVTVELDLGEGPRRYRRELNVMPQWAGSCWYELRYLDPINEAAFCDPEVERYWMGPRNLGDPGGVDLYVGGVEHAVLHLLYARFWHKVLYDLGHVSSWEPFRRLTTRATSRRTRTGTGAARSWKLPRSPRPRTVSAGTASRSCVSSGRWARA